MSGLNSIHTNNFPEILHQLGISLIVSTYQAGKVIILRNDNGKLNTHFRNFPKPMGMAVSDGKIALGTSFQIIDLRNIPNAAQRINPRHDACYLPRNIHLTGDIDIHEMAYIKDELWFINTKFSCLCTFDTNHSFTPRWKPPFISAYDLTDRCHLNGLAVKDEQIKYVTALGETDTANGWRENKARGGMLMDASTNEFICQGLSMPHSPRWYQNQLWVLESGDGSIAKVDESNRTWEAIAKLPGFTRGIDFYGDLAFIGLSKVRESAVFSGIPIAERLTERTCGIWVINMRTGNTEAFLKFTEGVEEIFAVQVLPGIRFPEIVNDNQELLTSCFVLPDEALAEVAQPRAEDIAKIRQQLVMQNAIASFVIVIPVYNLEEKGTKIIEATLTSIDKSLEYFQQNHPQANKFAYEVVIVDDASQDNTETVIKNLIKNKPEYRYFKHRENKGLAATRNTGVKNSTGKAIFFCDDDDLFLPEHIFTCITTLNQTLPPESQPMVRIPGNYPAAVKTEVKIKDKLHPYWYKSVVDVLALNTCIRREAHNFIEEFPEDEVFRLSTYGNEDYAYSKWLTTFFNVVWLKTQTVEYLRYPNNHFDKQLPRFQKPPGEYQEKISDQDKKYLAQIENIIAKRTQSLREKLQASNKADYFLNAGNQAYNHRNFKKAIHYYNHSLFLNPNLVHARYNLGVAYLDLEEKEAAKIVLEKVIQIEPNYAEAYNNLGNIYNRQGKYSEAIRYYRQAISLRNQFPDAHFNLGMTLLQIGKFEEGWRECEWRWQRHDFFPFQCPYPQWDGSDISDKNILIHTEQGAGDSIQFVRYLPLLAKKCQKVLLCCPENLVTLFQTVKGIHKIYTPGDIPLSEFQTYAPLMSLPLFFNTTLENIPSQVPYLGENLPSSSVDAKLTQFIKNNGQPNIGIVWAGSSTHVHDKYRSGNLDDFLPILKLTGFNFYSLQKGNKASQISQLPTEIDITDLSNYLGDYADTAKAIFQLDLIISVDTSVAHLAGALGKPIWILLDFNHDWRWLQTREDSPWYPTMKLFHQSILGKWNEVFVKVKENLRSHCYDHNQVD